MFIVEQYALAVALCIVTMLCWGSWANTQKLAGKTWRFELFYWDYVLGVLLAALIFAFTLGSTGTAGRPFLDDLRQATPGVLGSAFVGGIVFNAANILLVAAIALAGLAVAFPVGIGMALVLGVAGGMIWAVGMTLSIIAFGVAGPAISYGLGQGATMVAAAWGVFVWREFAAAPPGTAKLLALMFVCFMAGLGLIIAAGA
jgi:glucose uptake protein